MSMTMTDRHTAAVAALQAHSDSLAVVIAAVDASAMPRTMLAHDAARNLRTERKAIRHAIRWIEADRTCATDRVSDEIRNHPDRAMSKSAMVYVRWALDEHLNT